MSLWAEYVKEREGHEVIEEPWGFLRYHIAPPLLCIDDLYIQPEYRRGERGSELADRVTRIARESKCTHLWAQVWPHTLNATDSLKAVLAYGFQVTGAQNGAIILLKEIQ